jgi:hypothetical protein
MPKPDPLDDVPRIIHNEWFFAVARLCMIGASVIGLPIAAAMLSRVVSQADAMAHQVQEQGVSIRLLNATVGEKLNSNFSTLTDHELRLRALEKSTNVR